MTIFRSNDNFYKNVIKKSVFFRIAKLPSR
jgi:hypothetical protein